MMRIAPCFLLVFGLTAAALAQGSRTVSSYGLGNDSCGAFLEALGEAPTSGALDYENKKYLSKSRAYIEWVLGFVTAFNMFNAQNKNLSNADGPGITQWTRKWCEEHPMQSLRHAAWELIIVEGKFDPKIHK